MTSPADSVFGPDVQRDIEKEVGRLAPRIQPRWHLVIVLFTVGMSGFLYFVGHDMLMRFLGAATDGTLAPINAVRLAFLIAALMLSGIAQGASEFVNTSISQGFASTRFRAVFAAAPPAAKVILEGIMARALAQADTRSIRAIRISESGDYVVEFRKWRGNVLFSITLALSMLLFSNVSPPRSFDTMMDDVTSRRTAREKGEAQGASTTRRRSDQPADEPRPAAPAISELVHDRYIATEDAEAFGFTIPAPMLVQVLVEVNGDVPLDVVATQESITKEQWLLVAPVGEFSEALDGVAGTKNAQSVFGNSLSKKGAFRRFESPWVRVVTGPLVVIIDNTSAYTPTRGDAAVRLTLRSRAE
ncbi:hypothetical protein [Gemmatimonas sp.]|uniref:hypothetical protein n=1 Tax=Gemmatimonas sp. TaxID=1962908 RepID=UPI00286E44BF|nr:hypothetical protein [Gemmatimonas sp.]